MLGLGCGRCNRGSVLSFVERIEENPEEANYVDTSEMLADSGASSWIPC